MTPLSRWSALVLTLALATGLVCQHHEAGAQQKDEKKVETKKEEKKDETKKDEKKVETKKDEKKTEEKKTEEKKAEPKEEKKPPFEPDRPEAELKGHTDWINAIDFADDGKTLASASRDRTAKVWDATTGKDLQTFKGNPSNVKGLAYEQNIVYASTGKFSKEKKAWEGEIKAWDVKSGKDTKTLVGHSDEIECLALSKDGKFLASGSQDQTAKIWDLASGKDVQTFKGHTGAIQGVAFSPDGKKLATASGDGTVKLWDAQSGKDLATFKVAETKIKVKDAKGKETDAVEKGRPFTTVAFRPDGKRLAAGTLDGVIKLYDVDTQKEIQELKANEGIWALAYSPDGSRLASGGYVSSAYTPNGSIIQLWDANTGKEMQAIKAHLQTVTTLAFSPTAPRLASGSIDGKIKIWALK